MSVDAVAMYRVVCDWPGCGASVQDGTDYGYAWSDRESAVEVAADAFWLTFRHGHEHFCPDHPSAWASDLRDLADEPPERPYLFIHDGDTGDRQDDGTVTYIGREIG